METQQLTINVSTDTYQWLQQQQANLSIDPAAFAGCIIDKYVKVTEQLLPLSNVVRGPEPPIHPIA